MTDDEMFVEDTDPTCSEIVDHDQSDNANAVYCGMPAGLYGGDDEPFVWLCAKHIALWDKLKPKRMKK